MKFHESEPAKTIDNTKGLDSLEELKWSDPDCKVTADYEQGNKRKLQNISREKKVIKRDRID